MPFIDGGEKEKGELTGCGVLCQVACRRRRRKKGIGSRRKSSYGRNPLCASCYKERERRKRRVICQGFFSFLLRRVGFSGLIRRSRFGFFFLNGPGMPTTFYCTLYGSCSDNW